MSGIALIQCFCVGLIRSAVITHEWMRGETGGAKAANVSLCPDPVIRIRSPEHFLFIGERNRERNPAAPRERFGRETLPSLPNVRPPRGHQARGPEQMCGNCARFYLTLMSK